MILNRTFRHFVQLAQSIMGCLVLLLLTACGGGDVGINNGLPTTPPASKSFAVGGSVTGLSAGQSVVLALNGANPITVSGNGFFSFPELLPNGAQYSVSVQTQPSGNTCAINYYAGVMPFANVNNVAVVCGANQPSYSLGGTISGLTVSGLVLSDRYNLLNVPANATSFSFDLEFNSGFNYTASIVSQPPGFTESCSLANGTGVFGNANVTGLQVACHAAVAQVGVYSGNGMAGLANGTAISASFNQPTGLATDSSGDLFVADTGNNLIRQINTSGITSTLAGSGTAGALNGIGTAASFNQPTYLATDGQGNVYVSDTGNSVIRIISPQ